MKLATFFEKFDQFADAPDAVEKMRELVLDLAVKGKLTDRVLKKESVASEYSDEPSSDALPANWRLLNFGKFCDIQGGNQPPKSQFSDEPRPGYVRMFQIRDLGERPVPVYISKESTNRFCREGEILIGRYGASVGKVFWAQDGAYNVALAKFIFPEDALLPAFAFWVLKSDFFQAEIAGASRSAQAGFNKGDLAAIDFPLPPLPEQKRIVAKVDELMALCDGLEAKQQERETRHAALARASLARFADAPTPANLPFLFHPSYTIPPADLRKSILTLAVQGKLVPQDPNDEPARELCESDEEVAEAASFEVPHGWIWTRLAKLGEINGGFAFKSTAYTEEGTRVVRISDFDEFGFKDHKVVRHPFSADLQKFSLEQQNILMAMTGGTVGKSYFVRSMPEPMVVNQRVATIKVLDSALPSYIDVVIRSEMTQEVIRKAKNSTNDNISMGDIKGFMIPLPPLAEQRRIVEKVEQLMALVDALETQLAASRATAANLLSALVAELTGTPNNGKVSVPSATTTGRRGRPRKSS